jgi:hypothetical protein
MAAPTVGLTIIKRFTYRGNAMEEFSNHYWLTGATPADSAAWRTLFDALVTTEKQVYMSSVKVVAGYGYDSVDEHAHAVWSVDLTVAPNTVVSGTGPTGTNLAPGDASVWVRWALDRLNSKGKRIYLRKYFHGFSLDTSNPDLPLSTSGLVALGAKLDDGSFLAGRKVTDRLGTATVGHAASTYVTTRTLKRRGKRPPT